MAIQKRYDIGNRILGEGGFGSVTLGRDVNTGSPVAVKTVSKRRFEQGEVDMLKTLNTPHSIRYRHDFEVINPAKPDDAKHCIVMDFVNGRDITATYIQTNQTLSLPEIRSAAYQLLEFLAALEAKNIVYLDLKPENIIWQKPCRNLTVVDLGTAHQIGSVYDRKTGPTPSYAPPDYVLGKPFTHACDLWSAGVTFYSMICSKLLFEPKQNLTPMETYQHVLQQIVAQIGEPDRYFLTNGSRSYECFDGNLELRKKWLLGTPFINWRVSFLEGLGKLGASDKEKGQWLDLMSMLLSYENRGSAKEHLKRDLFASEMRVHLTYDPKCRCKLYLHRLELIGAPINSVDLSDIKEFDYQADFKIDKNCCIHLPESTTGEYAVFVELNGNLAIGKVTLQKGKALDIRGFQERLMREVKTSLMKRFNQDETSQKKARTDDAE